MLPVDLGWRVLFGVASTLLAACSRSDPKPKQGAAGSDEVTLTTARTDLGSTVTQLPPVAGDTTPARQPPPRRAIAGIAGFQSSSRVVFAAEPKKTHTLSATYLFPERVRIRLALAQEKSIDRVLLYRFGDQGFFIDEGVAKSREVVGNELLELRLETELRRALFLWPDGFPWSNEGGARSAELEDGGKLVAQLGSDGRPTSMQYFDPRAAPAETLQAIAWKKFGARQFPSHFELSAGGKLISTEEVLEVETALNYVDTFFLPPDRRRQDMPSSQGARSAPIESIDLPALWEFRAEFGATSPLTLQAARAAAEAACSSWKARGIVVLEETILELDREARPTAALLHAESVGAPHPDGWVRRVECPALSLVLERAEDADAAHIAALAAHCANESKSAKIELVWAATPVGHETWKLVMAQH